MLEIQMQDIGGITIKRQGMLLQDRGFRADKFLNFEEFYKAFLNYFKTDPLMFNEPANYLLTPAGETDLREAYNREVATKVLEHCDRIGRPV